VGVGASLRLGGNGMSTRLIRLFSAYSSGRRQPQLRTSGGNVQTETRGTRHRRARWIPLYPIFALLLLSYGMPAGPAGAGSLATVASAPEAIACGVSASRGSVPRLDCDLDRQ
jgi:hypothetical protein